jgi:hypothetical protein
MPKGSLKNRKILSSSSANRNTLKAEKEKEKKNEGTSHGDQGSSNVPDLQRLLKAQTEKNQRKPWNRLDRGIRIQKIRSWISSQDWPENVKAKAKELLVKKIKTGGLTSSNSIVYDKKACTIQEVQCLHLVYPIDVSGGEGDIPVDVLFRKNDRKTKRSSKA